MPVEVKGYLTYKEVIGEQSINIPDGETLTLSDLLNTLVTQIGNQLSDPIFDLETGLPGEHVAVILNGPGKGRRGFAALMGKTTVPAARAAPDPAVPVEDFNSFRARHLPPCAVRAPRFGAAALRGLS